MLVHDEEKSILGQGFYWLNLDSTKEHANIWIFHKKSKSQPPVTKELAYLTASVI